MQQTQKNKIIFFGLMVVAFFGVLNYTVFASETVKKNSSAIHVNYKQELETLEGCDNSHADELKFAYIAVPRSALVVICDGTRWVEVAQTNL
ncbi:MAG: hypothetical protein AAB588_00620 [Patescibacteria group bacterium]